MSRFLRKQVFLAIHRSHWSVDVTPPWSTATRRAAGGTCGEHGPVDRHLLEATLAPLKTSPLRPALHVTFGSELSRSFMVDPPPGTRNLRELRSVVQARFTRLYGESDSTWALRADWHPRCHFAVCAIRKEDLEAVRQLASKARMRIASLTADWVRLTATGSPPKADWAVVGSRDALTVLHFDMRHGSLRDVRVYPLQTAAQFVHAETLVGRHLMMAPLAANAGAPPRSVPKPAAVLWAGDAPWLPAHGIVAGRVAINAQRRSDRSVWWQA